MTQLTSLIEELASDLTHPKRPPSFGMLALEWLGVCLIYITLVLMVTSPRADLAIRLNEPRFLAEITLLLCTIIAAAFAAYLSSFPDMQQRRWALFIPAVPFFCFLLLLENLAHNPLPATEVSLAFTPNGIECVACITMFGFVPAVWLFARLRKFASTHLALTGAMAVLAAACAGCLAIRFAEPSDDALHMMLWHYLPLLGFSTLGTYLGIKLLKW